MHNRQFEPLNDPLAREIEQALDIEPSAEFQARIRQRVAPLSPRTPAMGRWSLAVAGGFAVLVMVWLGSGVSERGRDELAIADQPHVPAAVVISAPRVEEDVRREQAPAPVRERNSQPRSRRGVASAEPQSPRMPAIIISPDEAAAFDRLLEAVSSPDVVFVGVDDLLLDPVQPQQPDPLGIAAIEVAPLEVSPVEEAE